MSIETITTISPITNQPILTRNGVSAADLKLLPEVATEAFLKFRKTSLAERQVIVKNALKLLGDKQDILAKELTEQMGRPIAYTAKEVTTAVKRGEYLLKISEDTLKDTDGEAEKGFKRYIRKVPVGPVLILFAWNAGYFSAKFRLVLIASVSIFDSGQLPYTRPSRWKYGHLETFPPDTHHCRAYIFHF
jgi:acyl-CoA reductase-like NAD-dependent aldehyde dehydrogenase